MNFGAEYGMTIDSVRGQGTRVEIVIPAVPYEQPDQNPEQGDMASVPELPAGKTGQHTDTGFEE